MYVCIYLYIYVHTYIYIYIYIYVHTHTHTHTHTQDTLNGVFDGEKLGVRLIYVVIGVGKHCWRSVNYSHPRSRDEDYVY